MKRTLEIAGSLFCLVLVSPLLVIIALSIKVTSPHDEVIFKQERTGLGGKTFNILKFKTMRDGELVDGEFVDSEFEPCTDDWNDPRIKKPIGRILRLTKLDELPQLINILRGDMSFFGPRPLEVSQDQKLARKHKGYENRYAVRPGLISLSQIISYFTSRGDFDRRIKLDIERYSPYIHHPDVNKVCVKQEVVA